jgi:hypothetical protein
MERPNLLLTFKMPGASEPEVRGAARISVDGRGGILVYNAETGTPERISVDQLKSFQIDCPNDRRRSPKLVH